MAETTVRQVLIGILLFGAIIAGTFSMIAMSIPDNAGEFTDYNNSMNKFNIMKSNAEAISGDMEDAEPVSGPEGILTGLWDISFGAVNQVWNSVTVMTSIISDLSAGSLDPITIPEWFTGLLIAIILTTITFAIIASIRKWNV